MNLSGFVGEAEIDALAERVGELGDAAEEDWFDEEVVGAAVFVDGAGGEAEWATEGETEGLGYVSVERGAGFGVEEKEIFSDLVGEGELGGELGGARAGNGVVEVGEVGGGADAVLRDEGAVLIVVDVAEMDALGGAADVGLVVVADLCLPVDVVFGPAEAQLLYACIGPAEVGSSSSTLEEALRDSDLILVDIVGVAEQTAVGREEEATGEAGGVEVAVVFGVELGEEA